MPKLIPIKPKKLVKILHKLGFEERNAEDSYLLFTHPDGRTTTIPMRSREVSKGLLKKILNDIGVSVGEYDHLRNKI